MMGQSLSNLRQRRSARTLQELATPATPSIPPNLSRETLINGLQNVAAYIASKNQDITLIVVGGTINTVLLRSRPNTHDVDIFNDNLTPAEVKCLSKAAKSAFKETACSGRNGSTIIQFYSFLPIYGAFSRRWLLTSMKLFFKLRGSLFWPPLGHIYFVPRYIAYLVVE